MNYKSDEIQDMTFYKDLGYQPLGSCIIDLLSIHNQTIFGDAQYTMWPRITSVWQNAISVLTSPVLSQQTPLIHLHIDSPIALTKRFIPPKLQTLDEDNSNELTAYTIQQTPSICKVIQNRPTVQLSD